MIRSLYNRVLRLAETRWAVPALAGTAFLESAFLPIPPDALLIPMVLARRERAWLYAGICTVGSVLGGLLGYAIGYFLAPVGVWILNHMGHAGGLQSFRSWYGRYGVWVILVKGLTPIPYKLVTIASGLARFSLPMFVGASFVTRGARFFMEAGLLQFPQARALLDRHLGWAVGLTVLLLVLALLAVKLIG